MASKRRAPSPPPPPPPPPEEKSKSEQERKGPAPKAAPSSKAKKKAKAEAQKAAPEPTPSGKGKKAGSKGKPPALDSSPSSSKDDDTKILEALADLVRREGAMPKTDVVLSAVRDHLSSRKSYWGHADIYQTAHRLMKKYQEALRTGSVPSKEDEHHMYKLSEAIWGETAKEAATATTSQNDGADQNQGWSQDWPAGGADSSSSSSSNI